MPNVFDQFDAPESAPVQDRPRSPRNVFDQFDAPSPQEPAPTPSGAPPSLNPFSVAGENTGLAFGRVGRGLAELNPFDPVRHAAPETIPQKILGRGITQTGTALKDIGMGGLSVLGLPFSAAAEMGGNIAERAASAVVPGQKVIRSSDIQTAAMGIRPRAKALVGLGGPRPAEIPPEAGVKAPTDVRPDLPDDQRRRVPGAKGKRGAAPGAKKNVFDQFDPIKKNVFDQFDTAPAPRTEAPLDTSGPQGARTILRQQIGAGERTAAQARAQAEPMHAAVNALSDAERHDVMAYIEGRSTGAKLPAGLAEHQAAADLVRSTSKEALEGLQSTKSTESIHEVEDFFHHLWENPAKSKQAFGSAWKEGSAGGATKKRKYPTISEGLAAGRKLKNTNYLETHLDYMDYISRFTATNKAFEATREQGNIKYFTPGKEPEGFTALEGRHGGVNPHGQRAYAPEAFAKDWNKFSSQGFSKGSAVERTRQVTNFVTGVKLLGGYHLGTEIKESFVSDIARAIDNVSYGRLGEAGRAVGRASTVLGPAVRQGMRGSKGQAAYLGKGGTVEDKYLADLMADSNFRPTKVDKSISITSHGNLFTAWKRGALKGQIQSLGQNIKSAPGARKGLEAAKAAFNLTGRTLETVMAPLLQHAIPKIKTGAWMDMMGDWIKTHPTASREEIVAEGRRASDHIDDRFGEMNQDNLFINQKLKEGLQASMISYSWEYGTIRGFGGGAKDLAKAAIGSGPWTRRASYLLAYPIGMAYMNAVYQYLHTGKAPGSLLDLMAPQTGGTNEEKKSRGKIIREEGPERALTPGYEKDFFGLRDIFAGDKGKNFLNFALNKLNPALQLGRALVTGTDWRGDRISDPNASAMRQIGQYLAFSAKELLPIPVGAAEQRKTGTGIHLFETIVGIRPASDYFQAPSAHEKMERIAKTRDWISTMGHQKKQALSSGDTKRADVIQDEINASKSQLKHMEMESVK